LAASRPDHGAITRQLVAVSDRLYYFLSREGRLDEAISLLKETEIDVDRIANQTPPDYWAWLTRIRGTVKLATLVKRQGNPARHVLLLRRAIGLCEELLRSNPDADAIMDNGSSMTCASQTEMKRPGSI